VNLFKNRKTNWKYILIVIILATIVGGGILAWQYWWVPKEKGKTPEKITQDETADWKTYRNEDYGFAMKYPKDWVFEESKDEEGASIFFHTLKKDEYNMYFKNSFTIYIMKTTYTNVQKWFDNAYKDRSPELVPDKKIIIINDNEWLYIFDPITFGGCFGISITLIKNSRLYTITEYCGSETEEIVSTFRFLE